MSLLLAQEAMFHESKAIVSVHPTQKRRPPTLTVISSVVYQAAIDSGFTVRLKPIMLAPTVMCFLITNFAARD